MSGMIVAQGIAEAGPEGEALRGCFAGRRVVVLVQGNSKGLQGVKYRAAFEALRDYIPHLELWDIDVTGWRRALCLLRVFRFGLRRWRETFYSHPLTFDAYGRSFARKARAARVPVDAFVTFGVKFDAGLHAGGVPVVAFTDYTTALTARHAMRFRHPLDGAVSERRIAQERRALERMVAICTRSRFVADAIVTDYGIDPARLAVIGGGSNLNLAPRRPALRPEGAPIRFLFVGKAFLRKGGDVVLAAFGRLRESHAGAELALVTADAPREVPAGVTVYAAPDRDTFTGLFRRSDVFVLASRFETWGDVLIEAMSQGMPCICPDLPPLDEVVRDGEAGFLFRPGDVDDLARVMGLFCDDPSRRDRMGRAAFETVQSGFDWAVVCGKLARIVAAGIAGGRRGPEAAEAPGKPQHP